MSLQVPDSVKQPPVGETLGAKRPSQPEAAEKAAAPEDGIEQPPAAKRQRNPAPSSHAAPGRQPAPAAPDESGSLLALYRMVQGSPAPDTKTFKAWLRANNHGKDPTAETLAAMHETATEILGAAGMLKAGESERAPSAPMPAAPGPAAAPAAVVVPRPANDATPHRLHASGRVAVPTSVDSIRNVQSAENPHGRPDYGLTPWDGAPLEQLAAARASLKIVRLNGQFMNWTHVPPLSDFLGISIAARNGDDVMIESKDGAPWVGVRHGGMHFSTLEARGPDGCAEEFFVPPEEGPWHARYPAVTQRLAALDTNRALEPLTTRGDGNCLLHAIIQGVARRAGGLDRVPVLKNLVPEALHHVDYDAWTGDEKTLVVHRLRAAYADHLENLLGVDVYARVLADLGRDEMQSYGDRLRDDAVRYRRLTLGRNLPVLPHEVRVLEAQLEGAEQTLNDLAGRHDGARVASLLDQGLRNVAEARTILAELRAHF